MKRIILFTLFPIMAVLLLLIGCDKAANDWGEDSNCAGLFRPLNFGQQKLSATSILIKYNKILNATKYVFEFVREDENSDVKVYEILADTLTPFSTTNDAVKTEYRTLFQNLNSSTSYIVRMKGINENTNLESQYVSFNFTTPSEQLFKKTSHGVDYITMYWEPEAEVTHLVLYKYDRDASTYIYVKNIELAEEDIKTGMVTISGLDEGTNYRITLNRGDAVRGTKDIKTDGIGGGTTVIVSPSDNIAAAINNCLMQEIVDIVLVFKGGNTYNLGSISLPYGIENLTFVGDTSNGEEQPLLMFSGITFAMNRLQLISFQNVVIDGGDSGYMMSLGGAKGPGTISFSRCHIKKFGRCVARFTAGYERETDAVKFESCILENIGANGYGLLNLPSDLPTFGLVSLSNCTLINMGTNLYSSSSSIEEFLMEYCTIYNSTVAMNQVVRFDALPSSVSIKNCIFSGTNNGVSIKAGYSIYTTFDYSDGCYITSDLNVNNNNPFNGIVTYQGSAASLFRSPENGDFHFKDLSFAGINQAGDSRWWDE